MKKLILLYFLFFSFFCFSQKETIEVEYSVAIVDEVDLYGSINFYNTKLLTDGKKSEFLLTIKDTIFDSEMFGMIEDVSTSKFHKAYYKTNLKNQEVYYREKRGLRKAKVIKDNYKIVWSLSDETKVISSTGDLCYKAYCTFRGRDYEAFYLKDIPYSDGPFKFSGLPGLILEINSLDGAVKIKAKLITYIEESVPTNPYENLDNTINFEQYKKLYNKYFKKMTGYKPDLDSEMFVPKRYIEYVVNE